MLVYTSQEVCGIVVSFYAAGLFTDANLLHLICRLVAKIYSKRFHLICICLLMFLIALPFYHNVICRPNKAFAYRVSLDGHHIRLFLGIIPLQAYSCKVCSVSGIFSKKREISEFNCAFAILIS